MKCGCCVVLLVRISISVLLFPPQLPIPPSSHPSRRCVLACCLVYCVVVGGSSTIQRHISPDPKLHFIRPLAKFRPRNSPKRIYTSFKLHRFVTTVHKIGPNLCFLLRSQYEQPRSPILMINKREWGQYRRIKNHQEVFIIIIVVC